MSSLRKKKVDNIVSTDIHLSSGEVVKVDEGYAIVMLNGRRETELYTNEALRKLARKEVALTKVPPLIVIEQQLREKYQAHTVDEQERAT